MNSALCAIDGPGLRNGFDANLDSLQAACGPGVEVASGSLVALGARVGRADRW